jgi:MFS family permease
VPEVGTLRRVVSVAAIDLGPLRRHRDYRLLATGQALSFFGAELTVVTVPFQAYQLTHSTAVVGLLSLAEFVPLMGMAFVGGALSDAFDRRRLVQISELGSGLAMVLLTVNALLPHPQTWILFAVLPILAALYGLLRPSLDAMLPRLVTKEELPAAAAIDGFYFTFGSIAGPALAGAIIAAAGVPTAYTIDAATYGVSLIALWFMDAMPPAEDAPPVSPRSVAEGIRYARSRQELIGTYGVDIIAMFFGMPMALFPAIAQRFGGAGVLGLLYAAPAVGALLATATSGWVKRVHRHGLAVIFGAGTWGAGIIVFGFASTLPVALAALVVAGCGDMVSGIFRSTIWNQTIPDRLRGRLAGIEQVSYTSGPLLGNVEAGVVASVTSVRFSVVSGGVLCVVGVAMAAVLLPVFRRYDARAVLSSTPERGL